MAPATTCPSPHAATMTSASLVELSRESKRAVDWDRILVLRNDDKSTSQWKWIENARNFSIYTKQERAHSDDEFAASGSRFSVLSIGDVKASVSEISSLIMAESQAEYETKMGARYGKDFKSGEYLYNVKCDPRAFASKYPGELAPSQLAVRTVMFSNAKWFGTDEEVCHLDAIYHDHRSQSFEKLITVLRPQDVVSEERYAMSRFAKHRDLIGAYRIEPTRAKSHHDADAMNTAQPSPHRNGLGKKQPYVSRVYFHATISSPIQLSDLSSLSISSSSPYSSSKPEATVSKSVRQYLVYMAKETQRLSLLIRRRRLGVQTLVSKKRFPPTNKPCFVCARKLLVAKVCRVCGHGVCKDCSDKYDRERRSRSRKSKVTIESIRVCDPCLERVENADYSSINDESLMGPAVVPSADADAASAEAELGYLLRDALAESSTPEHKRSVMNVSKCVLVDEEGSILDESMNSTSASTPQSIALTDLRVENIPHDQAAYRSTEDRTYQLDTRDPDTALQAPVCDGEDKRLRAVAEVDINNLAESVELNILCELAARELGCKTSTISILDRDNLNCVASNVDALHKAKMPRNNTVCAHTILERTANIVPHPEADIRYADSSIVKDHGAKFYFGFPIVGDDDQIIGSFCVVNDETMEVTESKYTAFKKLSEACNKVVRIHSERRRKNSSHSSSSTSASQ